MVSGQLPPRKIAPRLGLEFGLGLRLVLGLGGNYPRTLLVEVIDMFLIGKKE